MNGHLDSTELLASRFGVWRTVVAKLPKKIFDLRATTLNNAVLIFGERIFSSYSQE